MGKKSKLKKLAARLGQLDQVAALPYRMGKQGLEILVVTSRKTKRLIIPKGWPMPGLSDSRAAEIEADEEAGVKGTVSKHPIGSFEYVKEIGSEGILVRAEVFPLEVKKLKSSWKEEKQRHRKWLPVSEALLELGDVDLKALIDRNHARIGSVQESESVAASGLGDRQIGRLPDAQRKEIEHLLSSIGDNPP